MCDDQQTLEMTDPWRDVCSFAVCGSIAFDVNEKNEGFFCLL